MAAWEPTGLGTVAWPPAGLRNVGALLDDLDDSLIVDLDGGGILLSGGFVPETTPDATSWTPVDL